MMEYDWEFLPEVTSVYSDKVAEIDNFIDLLLMLSNKNTELHYDKNYKKSFDFSKLLQDKATLTSNHPSYSMESIKPNTQQLHPLKSSVLLLIYNFIESISTITFKDITRSIIDDLEQNENNTNQINQKLKNYMIKTELRGRNKDSLIKTIIEENINDLSIYLIDKWIENNKKKLKRDFSLFAKNVDDTAFHQAANDYGLSFIKKLDDISIEEKKALSKIKDVRNKLSHGLATFTDIGQTISIDEIKEIYQNTLIFFKSHLDEINTLVKEKYYFENLNQ